MIYSSVLWKYYKDTGSSEILANYMIKGRKKWENEPGAIAEYAAGVRNRQKTLQGVKSLGGARKFPL